MLKVDFTSKLKNDFKTKPNYFGHETYRNIFSNRNILILKNRDWVEKNDTYEGESTIFDLLIWNLVKMITPWIGNIVKILAIAQTTTVSFWANIIFSTQYLFHLHILWMPNDRIQERSLSMWKYLFTWFFACFENIFSLDFLFTFSFIAN